MTTRQMDNLVRIAPRPMELRAADADEGGNLLCGYFTVFDEWTEIHSWFEGDFLERNAEGMLDETIVAREGLVKCLFDHGYDPTLGNMPLGPVRLLRGDSYYEVPLFPSVPGLLRDGLGAGVYGASYRFRVIRDTWVEPKSPSAHNPARLPERTIEEVELYEFGPVTFPAYEGASAGLRSGTDKFCDHLLNDPAFVARLAQRTDGHVVQKMIAQAQASDAPGRNPSRSTDGLGDTRGTHPSVLRIRAMASAAAARH